VNSPNLPTIRETSPLARGFTVSIAEAAPSWHLRVWVDGRPVCDELHDSPSKAAMRVGALVLDGTVGAKLRAEAADAVRRATGGLG
jgi:hypothetical protein